MTTNNLANILITLMILISLTLIHINCINVALPSVSCKVVKSENILCEPGLVFTYSGTCEIMKTPPEPFMLCHLVRCIHEIDTLLDVIFLLLQAD